LHKDAQILNIDSIFKLEIGKLIYNINFRLFPNNLQNFLQKSKHPFLSYKTTIKLLIWDASD